MILITRLAVFILLASSFCHSQQQKQVPAPKKEVRAVWITTLLGLDWPKSMDVGEQQRSLKEILVKLHQANFNTVFFQVRGRADAMYRSRYEPWSQQLTGTLGKNPGWDPLAFVVEQSHALGMEVHAWFNTFLVRSPKEKPSPSQPLHVVLAHPDWVQVVENEWWLDPGKPEVREYLENVAMDIVGNYDIDGFHFDFIRYPQKELSDESTYRKYGGAVTRGDWRRSNITAFLDSFHRAATRLKPMLKIGAAPIGIYKNTNGIRGLQSYTELYQDSRGWLQAGILDYLAPQVYWSLGAKPANPDFSAVVEEWSEYTADRHVYIGIGAFKPDVQTQLPELIDVVRRQKMEGHAFFRLESIANDLMLGGKYATPANIPPMRWKDSIPPNPPTALRVETVSENVFQLRWRTSSTARDGDDAVRFNIYRSVRQPVDTDDPGNLHFVSATPTTQFLDTILHPTAARYFYAVSALDRGNNESSSIEEGVLIPELATIVERLGSGSRLRVPYRDPDGKLVFFAYDLTEQATVSLRILDRNEREVSRIVDAVQVPGSYIAAANVSTLRSGEYSCVFVVGGVKETKVFRLED